MATAGTFLRLNTVPGCINTVTNHGLLFPKDLCHVTAICTNNT